MAWDPPSDSDLAADKPAKASDMRRIRDLFAALAAQDTGAPPVNGRGAYQTLRKFGHGGGPNNEGNRLQGVWTVPDGVYRIEVIVVGGGGAGGQGNHTIGSGGTAPGGGGGAGAVQFAVMVVEPGQVFPVTVGAGGNPSLISPFVDTSLDDFEIGDGGRTTFGAGALGVSRVAARGGRVGFAGSGSADDGDGGEGGPGVEEDGVTFTPWVFGANGDRAFRTVPGGDGPARSGRGASSLFGGGGAARVSNAVGGNASCAGAGGGGGYPAGLTSSALGGLGANGIVVVRY